MATYADPEKDSATDKESSSSRHHTTESVDTDGSVATTHDIEKHALGDATDGTVKEEEEIDPNIVDFDGPDDPENPYNWTKTKKWINGGCLSALTFITPLGSSMFAPGVPQVLQEFNSTDQLLGSFVVSIYVLGYAFGPMVLAPLSETYGRSIVYHVTNVLFVAFTIACAVASDLNMLIGFRFLAGTFGSTSISIGSGTISDMFRVEERGAAMAIWSMGPLLGPVVGPVAGSYLSAAKGWRWCFWVLTIVGGVAALAMLLFLRETYAPVLLQRKTERLRKETGNMNLKSKMDNGLTPKQHIMLSLIRPCKLLVRSPIVFFLSFYMAMVYGYLYLLFTTMTDVFQGKYGFSSKNVGLAFLGIGVGMFAGIGLAGGLSDRIVKKLAAKNGGVTKPEFRLPFMIPSAFVLPVGLFLYGWTAQNEVQYIVPIIGTAFVGFGMITSFMPIMTYLVDAFTLYAASVTAANTLLRSLLGALLPLAGPSMYRALGLGWGNSLLAFVALAMIPLPFLFWFYGERIRTSKRFALNL